MKIAWKYRLQKGLLCWVLVAIKKVIIQFHKLVNSVFVFSDNLSEGKFKMQICIKSRSPQVKSYSIGFVVMYRVGDWLKHEVKKYHLRVDQPENLQLQFDR